MIKQKISLGPKDYLVLGGSLKIENLNQNAVVTVDVPEFTVSGIVPDPTSILGGVSRSPLEVKKGYFKVQEKYKIKGKGKRLSDETRQIIEKALLSGVNPHIIANDHGISDATVYHYKNKLGLGKNKLKPIEKVSENVEFVPLPGEMRNVEDMVDEI